MCSALRSEAWLKITSMNETTSIITAATPVVPVADDIKKSPGPLNKRHAQLLASSESLGSAAQDADHAPTLEARDISANFVTQFVSDTNAARNKVADTLASRTAKLNATASEKKTAHALINGLREVQKAAKQIYARTNRIALKDYLVGKPLNGSRPNLEQTSQTIINKAAADTLPGITTAKLEALRASRQTWMDAVGAQAESHAVSLTDRAELSDMLRSIQDRKLAIQLAADAEWPHTDSENAGVRTTFGLHPKRPLIA